MVRKKRSPGGSRRKVVAPWQDRQPRPTIELTDHAKERLQERNVTVDELMRTVEAPDSIGPGNDEFTIRLEKRRSKSRTVVAIVEDAGDQIRVVTAWLK